MKLPELPSLENELNSNNVESSRDEGSLSKHEVSPFSLPSLDVSIDEVSIDTSNKKKKDKSEINNVNNVNNVPEIKFEDIPISNSTDTKPNLEMSNNIDDNNPYFEDIPLNTKPQFKTYFEDIPISEEVLNEEEKGSKVKNESPQVSQESIVKAIEDEVNSENISKPRPRPKLPGRHIRSKENQNNIENNEEDLEKDLNFKTTKDNNQSQETTNQEEIESTSHLNEAEIQEQAQVLKDQNVEDIEDKENFEDKENLETKNVDVEIQNDNENIEFEEKIAEFEIDEIEDEFVEDKFIEDKFIEDEYENDDIENQNMLNFIEEDNDDDEIETFKDDTENVDNEKKSSDKFKEIDDENISLFLNKLKFKLLSMFNKNSKNKKNNKLRKPKKNIDKFKLLNNKKNKKILTFFIGFLITGSIIAIIFSFVNSSSFMKGNKNIYKPLSEVELTVKEKDNDLKLYDFKYVDSNVVEFKVLNNGEISNDFSIDITFKSKKKDKIKSKELDCESDIIGLEPNETLTERLKCNEFIIDGAYKVNYKINKY